MVFFWMGLRSAVVSFTLQWIAASVHFLWLCYRKLHARAFNIIYASCAFYLFIIFLRSQLTQKTYELYVKFLHVYRHVRAWDKNTWMSRRYEQILTLLFFPPFPFFPLQWTHTSLNVLLTYVQFLCYIFGLLRGSLVFTWNVFLKHINNNRFLNVRISRDHVLFIGCDMCSPDVHVRFTF